MPTSDAESPDQISLAAEIVAAYVSNNSVPTGDLANLIHAVHTALTKLSARTAVPVAETLVPAVPIRKSITQGYIICLEDGKRFKSLKRHLASHGMTPEQYRLKWSLPKDYPMVAADYTASRSAFAKKIGLGRKVKGTGS
jgi:predicted transcriptional regulator